MRRSTLQPLSGQSPAEISTSAGMPTKMDQEESELIQAFEQGQLKSVASKSELARLKAAALHQLSGGVSKRAFRPRG